MFAKIFTSKLNLFLAAALTSPMVLTEPSITLPPSYLTTSFSSSQPFYSLPLTQPGTEFPHYNVSKGANISTPGNYSRHSLPSGALTRVNIGQSDYQANHNNSQLVSGIDIKDIPNVNDHDFSITINGFFLVRWFDHRLVIEDVKFGPEGDDLVPVDISLVSGDILLFRDCWLPSLFFVAIKVTIFY